MSNHKIIIKNEKAMMELGGKIADQFLKGGIILLNGDLGAGKTTLVRGLLRHLGYKGIVKSPTYTLVEPYQLEQQFEQQLEQKITPRMIYHFDLYRLGDPEELEYIGGRDYWQGDNLCLLEWPEKAKGYLPKENLNINILHHGESRIVEITSGSIHS